MTSRWSPSSTTPSTPPGWPNPGATCFILTNTRSLPEDAAVELNSCGGRQPVRARREARRTGRSRQPQRLDPARSRHRRDRRASTAPAARSSAAASTACCWSRRTSRPAGSPPATSTGPRSAASRPGRGERVRPGRHLRLLVVGSARVRRGEERRHHRDRSGAQHQLGRHPARRTGPGRRDPRRRHRRRVRGGQCHRLRRTWRSSCSDCSRRRQAASRSSTDCGPSFPQVLAGLDPQEPLTAGPDLAGRQSRRARAGRRRIARRAHQPAGRQGPGTRRPDRGRAGRPDADRPGTA